MAKKSVKEPETTPEVPGVKPSTVISEPYIDENGELKYKETIIE